MADFAITGEAVGNVLGMEKGAFLEAFAETQTAANENIIDASPLGESVRALASDKGVWTGTASDLLDALKHYVDEETVRRKNWPRDASRLSRALSRLAPSFILEGINLEFDTPARRLITITRIHETTDITVVSGGNGADHTYKRQFVNDGNPVGTSVDDTGIGKAMASDQARFDANDGDVGKKRHPPGPCSKCGGRKFWERGDGVILCGTCHPNPKPL